MNFCSIIGWYILDIRHVEFKMTMMIKDGKLYIEYDYTDSVAIMVDEFNKNTGKSQESDRDYKKHAKQEVIVVENGLMYNGHFFEKVTK